MQRLTISVDDDIAQAFEELIAKRGYKNRSEAFRDLLRRELSQEALTRGLPGKDECMAVVSYGFDHHSRNLSAKVNEQQHAHHESIVASMHVHANHDHCVEVVVMRGAYETVRPLAEEMIAETGIENGAVHYVALPADGGHTHAHDHAHDHGYEHTHDHSHNSEEKNTK